MSCPPSSNDPPSRPSFDEDVGGENDGIFELNEDTGRITVRDCSKLDHESAPLLTLTVRIVDGGGECAYWSPVLFRVGVDGRMEESSCRATPLCAAVGPLAAAEPTSRGPALPPSGLCTSHLRPVSASFFLSSPSCNGNHIRPCPITASILITAMSLVLTAMRL